MTFGLYCHIPFCLRVCDYCNFFVQGLPPHDLDQQRRYMRALKGEWERRHEAWGVLGPITTFYFGGGTPSLIHPRIMEEFVEVLEDHTALTDAEEVTMEIDPHVVNEAKLRLYKDWGISRLSVGVQSFQEDTLHSLGRPQTPAQALRTLERIFKIGFREVSVDLIFGAPGQGVENFMGDLKQTLSFPVDHVSLYNLTYEEGTPLYQRMKNGDVVPVEEEVEYVMYHAARSFLEKQGLHQYEISNFSRPGCEGRHNKLYWDYEDCLGLGAGAVSFRRVSGNGKFSGRRRHNVKNLEKYFRGDPGEIEILEGETAMGEFMMLGLRKTEGVFFKDFEFLFGISLEEAYGPILNKMTDQNLLEVTQENVRLSEQALFISNEVLKEFVGVAAPTSHLGNSPFIEL